LLRLDAVDTVDPFEGIPDVRFTVVQDMPDTRSVRSVLMAGR